MAVGGAAGILAGCLVSPAQAATAEEAPAAVACPADLAEKATCYSGQDSHLSLIHI